MAEGHRLQRRQKKQVAGAVPEQAARRDLAHDIGHRAWQEPSAQGESESHRSDDAQADQQLALLGPHRRDADEHDGPDHDDERHRDRQPPRRGNDIEVPDATEAQHGTDPAQDTLGLDVEQADGRPIGLRDGGMEEAGDDPWCVDGCRHQDDQESLALTLALDREGDEGAHQSGGWCQGGGGERDDHRWPGGPVVLLHRIDEPGHSGVRDQQRPVAEDEALGDEGIPHVEGQGGELGDQRRRTKQASHAETGHEERADQDRLLDEHCGKDRAEQSREGIGGYGPRQCRTETPYVRAGHGQMGHPDHVVRQDIAGTEQGRADEYGEDGRPEGHSMADDACHSSAPP